MDRGSNEKVLKAPDEGILKGHIKQYIFLLVENCMEGGGGTKQRVLKAADEGILK